MVDHAELHPHGLCPDEDCLLDRFGGGFGAAEDVDYVDRHADLGELAPHEFAQHMLAGDLRVHRENAVAPALEELHHPIGRPVRPIGGADDGDRARVPQEPGNILVAGERHGAATFLVDRCFQSREQLARERGERFGFRSGRRCRRRSGVGGFADR